MSKKSSQTSKKGFLSWVRSVWPRGISLFWDLEAWLRRHILATATMILSVIWVTVSISVYYLERNVEGANVKSISDGLWWGLITLLTVGYGDRYPVTDTGRILGGILAIAGVITIGIVTAKISSFFLEQALRAGRAIVDTESLKDHFVICGWMEDMHELLKHVLEFNSNLKPEEIVVVAYVQKTWIDDVRAIKGLEKVQFILGEYYQEVTLRRAAPDRARKVMILADRTPSATGQIPSPTEIDARTVMTAMTLSNIARGTLVAAEVLDPKMDQYLKLAAVSEVIYSNEYSRLLLANASGGTGVTNILFDLLDPSTSSFITTREIPAEMIGKTYGEMRKKMDAASKLVVIGVLENTGNIHRIKEDALRKAQKTPDVKKLVENLKAVKGIRCNAPLFNPSDDFKVPEGSLAIVVETKPNAPRWKGTENDGHVA